MIFVGLGGSAGLCYGGRTLAEDFFAEVEFGQGLGLQDEAEVGGD